VRAFLFGLELEDDADVAVGPADEKKERKTSDELHAASLCFFLETCRHARRDHVWCPLSFSHVSFALLCFFLLLFPDLVFDIDFKINLL
jgi:hypothetical protein